MTKTDAIRKGLLLNGWTRYTGDDNRSGRECYTKMLAMKSSPTTMRAAFMFVGHGSLRMSVDTPLFTKSNAVSDRRTDGYETCGRTGMNHEQLAAQNAKLHAAAAGLAALKRST